MEDWTFHDLTTHVTARAGSQDSLDPLDTALGLSARLGHDADRLIDHFVTAARADGRSWTEIGFRLGVSRQAARQRFTGPARPAPVLPPRVRLRPRLQTCMTAAQRHAQQAGATEIGTDHLLAGLLADGVAAATLDKLGVTTDAITAAARRLFGPPHPASSAAPPLSAEAACAIEAAAHHTTAATAHRPDPSVDTEHLLLVLALDPGSRARRVLADLGADIATIKKELACHITGTPHRPRRMGRRRQARHPAWLVLRRRRNPGAARGPRPRRGHLWHLRPPGAGKHRRPHHAVTGEATHARRKPAVHHHGAARHPGPDPDPRAVRPGHRVGRQTPSPHKRHRQPHARPGGVVEPAGHGYGFTLGPTWLRDCGLAAGDTATIDVQPEGPQRADPADDITTALDAHPAATTFYSLAQFYRNAYLRWIDATKRRPDQRAERITEVIRQLESGQKQRPRQQS